MLQLAPVAELNRSTFEFPIHLPNRLVWAGVLLTVALAADLLQYVYATIAFGAFSRFHERKADNPTDFPSAINWPTNVFFWSKLAFTGGAWLLLLIHLLDNVS